MMNQPLKKNITQVTTEVSGVAEQTLDTLAYVVKSTESTIDQTVAPARKSILKRFPIIFLLAVTFGFTATVVGIEQILIQFEVLQKHPSLILCIGILILIMTGTAYKKLG
jgi:hypothetical protein